MIKPPLHTFLGDNMRDEYNIAELNPRKNPYASRDRQQITLNIDGSTINYFKSLAESKGIPLSDLDQSLFERLCRQSAAAPDVLATNIPG